MREHRSFFWTEVGQYFAFTSIGLDKLLLGKTWVFNFSLFFFFFFSFFFFFLRNFYGSIATVWKLLICLKRFSFEKKTFITHVNFSLVKSRFQFVQCLGDIFAQFQISSYEEHFLSIITYSNFPYMPFSNLTSPYVIGFRNNKISY